MKHLDSLKKRFFVALLPPQDIQATVNEVKQHFADRYASRAAQKSPPHITLQPPFEWFTEEVPILEQKLREFATEKSLISVTLEGFGAFPPRVVYVSVLKTVELLTLQQDLMNYLETKLNIVDPGSKTRSFTPHMTVGFHDLTPANFKAAWAEFQPRPFHVELIVDRLTLLIHTGQRWEIAAEFPLVARRVVSG